MNFNTFIKYCLFYLSWASTILRVKFYVQPSNSSKLSKIERGNHIFCVHFRDMFECKPFQRAWWNILEKNMHFGLDFSLAFVDKIHSSHSFYAYPFENLLILFRMSCQTKCALTQNAFNYLKMFCSLDSNLTIK